MPSRKASSENPNRVPAVSERRRTAERRPLDPPIQIGGPPGPGRLGETLTSENLTYWPSELGPVSGPVLANREEVLLEAGAAIVEPRPQEPNSRSIQPAPIPSSAVRWRARRGWRSPWQLGPGCRRQHDDRGAKLDALVTPAM